MRADLDALLERTDERRRWAGATAESGQRGALAQVSTPPSTAEFMARMFDLPQGGQIRLLDPGAGVGSLSLAVLARCLAERHSGELHVVAYEVDAALASVLAETFADARCVAEDHGFRLSYEIRVENFLTTRATRGDQGTFTASILNPPYRKLATRSAERKALEELGVSATNLYSAFLAVVATQMAPDGQVVAITPRSFANGVYFEPFRRFYFSTLSLECIHLYERRGEVFAEADVLQENVVFRSARRPPPTTIDVSTDADADGLTHRAIPYGEVMRPDDPHMFIRLPVNADDTEVAERIAQLPETLDGLGLKVSTGRVVDFRARDHLRQDADINDAPLIYPGHLRNGRVTWPMGSRKPNAIQRCTETESLLLPNQTYVLVKRFTAKEERKRVVAALCSEREVPGPVVGFENHLNVFHDHGHGLSRDVAIGLAAFLNSTTVDSYIRQFSGHTQINATDLRSLRYPALAELVALGRAVGEAPCFEQDIVDDAVKNHVLAWRDEAPASLAA